MAVINCICGAELRAGDEDALLQALREHHNQAHSETPLSDADLREWIAARSRTARWEGERRALSAGPEVRELNAERLDDFLRFFDRDAFMDNPAWASCYCLFYDFAGTAEEWERRSGEQNRADKASLIASGRALGYMAYDGDKVVGWCHAAPRAWLPGLDRNEELRTEDASDVGSIVCFVVAAPYRNQGIATRLLDAACRGLRGHGLSIAEAYPRRDAASDARAYHGPLEMYLRAGFTPYREAGAWVIVRKDLSGERSD